MKYAICTVAAAPLRKEPAHRSEMTSQLLFGEAVEVLGSDREWLHVRATHDAYEGWLTHHMVEEAGEGAATEPAPFIALGLVNPISVSGGLLNAPMGSSLPGLDPDSGLLWDGQHQYHGSYLDVRQPHSRELLERTLQAWINAPYLWGGRTFLGVDCSGFAQVVFKIMGIPLRRDAYQQAEQGEAVDFPEDVSSGDLAFFRNEEGRITHVGVLLNQNTIIHASGKVRIDPIDKEGILHSKTGIRTHHLHSVRRMARFL
jgi:hypothetical protein